MALAQLMGWLPVVVVLGGAVTALLGRYAWQHRAVPGATPLAVNLSLMTLWAITYAVRLSTIDPTLHLVLYRIEMVGAWFVPVAWLLFALEYTGHSEWVTRRTVGFLGALPVVGLVLLWTAPTGTMMANLSVHHAGPVSVLTFDRQPAYVAVQGYFILLIAAATALLVGMVVRMRNLYTDQAAALLVGSAAPVLVFLVGNLAPGAVARVAGRPSDLIPLTFPVTGALFLFAVFRTELFEQLSTTPEAGRDTAFEAMGDPAFVTDEDGDIIEYNSAATVLLDTETSPSHVSDIPTLADVELGSEETVTEVVSPDNRRFETRVAPIRDVHDRRIGYCLVLREITERERFRQRLEVTNRVLRHNLRNNLNVVLGRADNIRDSADDDAVAAAAGEIREAAEELATTGMKARQVEEFLGTDIEIRETDFGAVAAKIVEAVGDAHPQAELIVEADNPATARAVPGIEVALRETVENAIVHSGEEPVVGVTVEHTGADVVVTVADHGPGIPDHERRVLLDSGETQIEHGSGAGLWLMKWLVERSGGHLDIESGSGGTTVRMSFETGGNRGS